MAFLLEKWYLDLVSSAAGAIEWSCLMPRAGARVVTASGRVEGLGYAERLRLTLPPWAVPFQAVRRGRHVSADRAVVWMEWDGEVSRRATWLDGVPQPDARADAAQLSRSSPVDADGRALDDGWTIHEVVAW